MHVAYSPNIPYFFSYFCRCSHISFFFKLKIQMLNLFMINVVALKRAHCFVEEGLLLVRLEDRKMADVKVGFQFFKTSVRSRNQLFPGADATFPNRGEEVVEGCLALGTAIEGIATPIERTVGLGTGPHGGEPRQVLVVRPGEVLVVRPGGRHDLGLLGESGPSHDLGLLGESGPVGFDDGLLAVGHLGDLAVECCVAAGGWEQTDGYKRNMKYL